MAMLADRKRKEKWCQNPRGKSWSEDNSKFGQRLLEKMGWNTGQGLGINNQGPTEIVKVKKKDDSKGLGFKENGEEWLKTTSDYNELLEQLGSSLGEEGKEEADLASSLEYRSKKSKSRVHYHKFTRGKDLSRYSEKELASIIGPDVVKFKTIDISASDYASNQVNKGSSTEYFSLKKKTARPSQLDDGVKAESFNLNQSSNNSEEDKTSNQTSKTKKSVEDVPSPILASELFTKEITKLEKKKKNKKKKDINSDSEKETEENVVLPSNFENTPKKKKKVEETENSSSVDFKGKNSSTHCEENQTKNIVLNSFEEPLKKKKKNKKKHNKSLPQIEDNENFTNNEIAAMSADYSTYIGRKGSKQKKENLEDEIKSRCMSDQINSNESNNGSYDMDKNKVTKKMSRINTEKRQLATEEINNLNESNMIDAESEVISRKKKKLHNDSLSIDTVNKKDDKTCADSEQTEKAKKKKTKNDISNDVEVPEIKVLKSDKLKKDITSETGNKGLDLEKIQDKLIFKTKRKDKQNKKKLESESEFELHKEQPLVKMKQATSSEAGEFLEVLGRKTRLRKIDLPNKPAEHVRFETEDFISISSVPKKSSPPSYPPKTINSNIRISQKLPLPKVQIEPSQQDLDLPKGVIILEYRLLTKKLKELNLTAPEMKIIIKDKSLARATCRKLKQLQKSKQIKAVLPTEHLAEVEAAVKKYSEELKPKIDMIKKLAEIEKKTVLIAEELPDESRLQLKEEDKQLQILGPEKVKVVKKMSKQLKKLLIEKSTEETAKSTETGQVTASKKRKSDNSLEPNSLHKKLKCNLEKTESEKLEFVSKEKVQLTNSLQKRIEERLKDLAEQMKMLKEGKKPVITPTLQPKQHGMKESYTKRVFSHQNFLSFTRGRSQGAQRGTYLGGSFDPQNRTEPNRHLFFTQNENSDSLGEEPKTFERPGGRRGFSVGLRGVRGAIPRGGWGVLKSYGMLSETAGGFINRGQFSRGSFVRGRTLRGRCELLRGRGRISQNNFDAKQYAEKCKQLNKIPEIAFKGVDLGVITGYAASQAVGSTMSPSKPIAGFNETSCEVFVSKEQVKNSPDSVKHVDVIEIYEGWTQKKPE